MNRSVDIAIVGGGTMGLATAAALAEHAERSVALFDAGQPPHAGGAHHGHTRLMRCAYGEGGHYVELALAARRGWRTMAGRADPLVWEECGVLNLGDIGNGFVAEALASAAAFDLPVEHLDGGRVAARWPGWASVDEQQAGFEPGAGVVRCERALSGWRQRVALAPQMTIHDDTPIAGLKPRAGQWEIETATGDRFTARRCLLACGKALMPLAAGLGRTLPLTRLRKVFAWFDADARYAPGVFPGFSFTGALGDYYGFPALDGRGVKIGRHDGGQEVLPDEALAPFGAHAADQADLARLIDAHLPGVGALQHGAVCEYINTPDGDFLIDEMAPGLIVAGGFSGHGFKFASAIGAGLADWLLHSRRPAVFEPFGAHRFAADRDALPGSSSEGRSSG